MTAESFQCRDCKSLFSVHERRNEFPFCPDCGHRRVDALQAAPVTAGGPDSTPSRSVSRFVYWNWSDGVDEFRIVGCCPACRSIVTVAMPITAEVGRSGSADVGVVMAEEMLRHLTVEWDGHLATHR